MEGIQVRKPYELAVKTTGVHWEKRGYKTEGWGQADPVNQALSVENLNRLPPVAMSNSIAISVCVSS